MTTSVRTKLIVTNKSSSPQPLTARFPASRTTVRADKKTALTILAIMVVVDESSEGKSQTLA